jgi:hypothetical protein
MIETPQLSEPADVLYRIKRGLSGYVSYLAACEMNKSFSEYILYEPILRILTARNFVVDCEVDCPGVREPKTGDHKRLDFVASCDSVRFALEVKWAKSKRLNVTGDHAKLEAFLRAAGTPMRRAFLCVFGRESHIDDLALAPDEFRELGDPVVARLGKTRYGCRVFELKARSGRQRRSCPGRSRASLSGHEGGA